MYLTEDMLMGDQPAAYQFYKDRGIFRPSGQHLSLQGYAGTGKTELIGFIARKAVERGLPVRIATPTHKAAEVVRSKMAGSGLLGDVDIGTVHSMLGLKVSRGRGGTYVLKRDKYKEPSIPEKGLVIVEEASMIGQSLWGWLDAEMCRDKVAWLFVGDPAQLQPVKDEPSPALEGEGVVMEKVLRVAEGNPITQFATRVRQPGFRDFPRRRGQVPHCHDPEDGPVGVFLRDRSKTIIGSYCKQYRKAKKEAKENGESPPPRPSLRILAHTNKKVRWYNNRVRERLFPETTKEKPWAEGMKVVVMDTFFYQGELKAHASEELIIEEMHTGSRTVVEKTYETDVLKLKSRRSGRKVTLQIPTAEEQRRIDEHIDVYREQAKVDRSKWYKYYDLLEAFARIQPSFASTVTKAQGSEWDIVYVDSRDFYTARDEKQHVQYTAVTRAKKRLVVVVPEAKGRDDL